MRQDRLPYVVELMTLADVDQVMEIEEVVFPSPWSARAYRYEVSENEHSTMIVVRPAARPGGALRQLVRSFKLDRSAPVLGYAGFWLLVDEAHIATIAVCPECQGHGLGELLLLSLLDRSAEQDAHRVTLEVRVSNLVAQKLYHKYGFQIVSRRKHYYADNNEDAYIMTTPPFKTSEFRAVLRERRTELYARLRAEHACRGQENG